MWERYTYVVFIRKEKKHTHTNSTRACGSATYVLCFHQCSGATNIKAERRTKKKTLEVSPFSLSGQNRSEPVGCPSQPCAGKKENKKKEEKGRFTSFFFHRRYVLFLPSPPEEQHTHERQKKKKRKDAGTVFFFPPLSTMAICPFPPLFSEKAQTQV